MITNLFKPLPVRHKEFQRNAKREFGKALNLLHAYALVPCAGVGNGDKKGVRLTVSNHPDTGCVCVSYRDPEIQDGHAGAKLCNCAPMVRHQFGPPLHPYGVPKLSTIWSIWM